MRLDTLTSDKTHKFNKIAAKKSLSSRSRERRELLRRTNMREAYMSKRFFSYSGDQYRDEERLNSHSCKKVLLRRSPHRASCNSNVLVICEDIAATYSCMQTGNISGCGAEARGKEKKIMQKQIRERVRFLFQVC